MNQLREWIEPGIPNDQHSFLLLGEWWRFKNLNDFVTQHPNMFDADDEIEALEAERDDLQTELDDKDKLIEELKDCVDDTTQAILAKMEDFNVLGLTELTREELEERVDKEEQAWYNDIIEFQMKYTEKQINKERKSWKI